MHLDLQSTLLADRDPDTKNRGTEGSAFLRDTPMDRHVNSKLSSWEEIKKPFIFFKGSFNFLTVSLWEMFLGKLRFQV